MEPTDLDPIDRTILELLQQDSRQTNQALAERVGLSASACHRRVRRLEADGIILRYTAQLDEARLGRGQTVFAEITLHSQDRETLRRFERAVLACPEVTACHLMSGNTDYLVRVAASGVDDYERIHRDHLSTLPGVHRVRSYFALRTITDRDITAGQ